MSAVNYTKKKASKIRYAQASLSRIIILKGKKCLGLVKASMRFKWIHVYITYVFFEP